MADLNYLFERLQSYNASDIDHTISASDTMFSHVDSSGKVEQVRVYLDIGRSAVVNIFIGLCASWVHRVRRVLDLPCGHGRVLRHLVRLFPDAEFDVCDLNEGGVQFCAKTFGANSIPSREDLTQVSLPGEYDLIWVGSLFTHTARDVTTAWLRHLSGFLAPNGIIVATFHGRWCESAHSVVKYIEPSGWARILEGYRRSGYGYADYGEGVLPGASESSFGVSLARPSVIVQDLERLPGVRLFLYRERGWADHQDVAVIGRPAFDEPWPVVPRAS